MRYAPARGSQMTDETMCTHMTIFSFRVGVGQTLVHLDGE